MQQNNRWAVATRGDQRPRCVPIAQISYRTREITLSRPGDGVQETACRRQIRPSFLQPHSDSIGSHGEAYGRGHLTPAQGELASWWWPAAAANWSGKAKSTASLQQTGEHEPECSPSHSFGRLCVYCDPVVPACYAGAGSGGSCRLPMRRRREAAQGRCVLTQSRLAKPAHRSPSSGTEHSAPDTYRWRSGGLSAHRPDCTIARAPPVQGLGTLPAASSQVRLDRRAPLSS